MLGENSRTLFALLVASQIGFAGCASSPQVDAHLAVTPDDGFSSANWGDSPRFMGCPSCPELSRQLPGGRSLTVTVSPDPLYSLRARDIVDVVIYEERSTLVRGTRSYTVYVTPTPDWLSQSEATRDAYPYDTVAWLDSGSVVAVGPNINRRQQGSFGVAAFFCHAHAIRFVKAMGLQYVYVTQTDEEYDASAKAWNANIEAAAAEIKADPEHAAEKYPEFSAEQIAFFASDEFTTLPMEPELYYGADYRPVVCE
jgi:hypothetical protein